LELLAVLTVVLLPPCCQGTTQFDWQVAACELQVIMQVVTAEVCASLILPAVSAPAGDILPSPVTNAATLIAKTAHTIASRRILAPRSIARRAYHSAAACAGECRRAA
jgi:hypothetical protein